MSVCEMNKVDRSTVISGRGNDDGGSGSDDNNNNDDDDEKASDTKHQHVVKKSSEPGVINDAMLKNLIRAHGPRGEAARLCRNIAIDYGTITELCLEYQNILKIDHIWMFFNLQKLSLKANKLTNIENLDNLTELRELDLSFNFIKTIKNLECLRKLQYLTLFQNDIRKIDNLDQLEHLVRLNLGNNFIETVEGIESLRYKEQLFSLNLEGNPICDKLTDNIDFRLYIAAYLPKLKYYGYQVITNAERDKGREIYKNKLRMLEENESEQSTQRHEQSLEVELLRISVASFVEDLDKHQLFESLFANSFDNIVSDSETSLNDTNKSDIQLYRNRVYAAAREMHSYGIQCHDERANEIKLFDEALANSCEQVQAIGIELIDKFLGQKNDFVTKLKQTLHTMAKSTDDDDDNDATNSIGNDGNFLQKNRTHCDAISDNFATVVDNIWYTLIELETSLHERIMDSMKMFSDTIRTIIENFNDKSNETFHSIRSACDAYFQSNAADCPGYNGTMRERHVSIINQKLDLMCCKANKWLTEVTERYELAEYKRDRAKIMEISSFIDAERSAFAELKDNLIAKYELQAYF